MQKEIFKRKIYTRILDWKNISRGKTALLIEGPRRVGKSTVVRYFAQNEYDSYILIDFNKVSDEIKNLFNDLSNLDYIFLALQTFFHVSLKKRNSVIIFDEVQKCPAARQSIKYLVEDGRYDYIETGSLISIKKNTINITIPSEEERLEMYPMDFEEFRWAMGDFTTIPLLKEFWANGKSLGLIHRQISRDFRLFMLVGGMPQAVEEYIKSNDFSFVDKVKRNILKLYEDDFLKIDPTGRISKLFMSIPGQLNSKGLKFSSPLIIGKQSEKTLLEMIKALEDSKTVCIVYHCDDPNIGMPLTANDQMFKIYLADTGLFVTLAFWDREVSENLIYSKLLSNKLSANLGYIYENIVSQLLTCNGHRPFYYTWKYDDKHSYEIDFLISNGTKICPIEVKSSSILTHKSLDVFTKKYSSRISREFLVAPKDYREEGNLFIIPPFFVPFI